MFAKTQRTFTCRGCAVLYASGVGDAIMLGLIQHKKKKKGSWHAAFRNRRGPGTRSGRRPRRRSHRQRVADGNCEGFGTLRHHLHECDPDGCYSVDRYRHLHEHRQARRPTKAGPYRRPDDKLLLDYGDSGDRNRYGDDESRPAVRKRNRHAASRGNDDSRIAEHRGVSGQSRAIQSVRRRECRCDIATNRFHRARCRCDRHACQGTS